LDFETLTNYTNKKYKKLKNNACFSYSVHGFTHLLANRGHQSGELLTVFADDDRLDWGAEHFAVVLLENFAPVKGDAAVEGGLSAKTERDGVGSFTFYDLKIRKRTFLIAY